MPRCQSCRGAGDENEGADAESLFGRMVLHKMRATETEQFLEILFPRTELQKKKGVEPQRWMRIKAILQNEQITPPKTKGTLWALYNAIARDEDYRESRAEAPDRRLDRVWFGSGNDLTLQVLKLAETLVNILFRVGKALRTEFETGGGARGPKRGPSIWRSAFGRSGCHDQTFLAAVRRCCWPWLRLLIHSPGCRHPLPAEMLCAKRRRLSRTAGKFFSFRVLRYSPPWITRAAAGLAGYGATHKPDTLVT